MRHIIKKFLITISLIFSLSCFQPCYAIGGIMEGIFIGAIGMGTVSTMLQSIISSINARSSVQGSATQAQENTTIELYKKDTLGNLTTIPTSQDIVLKNAPAAQTFVYKNVGSSNWLNPSVSWQTMFDDPDPVTHPTGSEYYVALKNNTCNSLSSIAPGGSCSFDLVTNHDHPGDWGIIKATGDNLLGGTQYKNVLAGSGLEITMNLNTAEYHLGYRSLKLTNTITDGNIWISGITADENLLAGTDPVVKYCDPDADPTVCAYKTNCHIYSTQQTSLAPGESCLVWFKAQSKKTDNTDLPLQTISDTTGRLKVTVAAEKQIHGGTWASISEYEKDSTFKTTYNKSLYVGGTFATVGGITVNNVAKWDGTTWSALVSSNPSDPIGVHSMVRAFTNTNGDLYVGGDFYYAGSVNPANNIAKWNGSSWSALSSGAGITYPGVYALSSIGNDLYVGGAFTNPASFIAKWNILSSSWSALGFGMDGPVYALVNFNGATHAGGNFMFSRDVPMRRIAKWDGSAWSALGSPTNGTDGTIYTLTTIETGANAGLYAGGTFTTAGSINPANNIAKWDGANWFALGSPNGTNGSIFALTNDNGSGGNNVYVGGTFTTAGPLTANGIARWDGTAWQPMGTGSISGGVEALTSIKTGANTDVYAGGTFTSIKGVTTNYIAKWNGTTWSALVGGGIVYGVSNLVKALTIAPAIAVTDYAWPGT